MKKWGTILTLGVVLLAASSASASEEDRSVPGTFGAFHPEVATRMMAGTQLTPSESAPGPMTGGGLGVRAGVSYLGLYGGLSFVDFMSETDGTEGNTERTHASSYGAEFGYGISLLRHLTLRGQLGLGDYAVASQWTVSRCVEATACSATPMQSRATGNKAYLAPALLIEATFGPVLIGLDANLFYIPSGGYLQSGPADERGATFAALMVGAQVGVKL